MFYFKIAIFQKYKVVKSNSPNLNYSALMHINITIYEIKLIIKIYNKYPIKKFKI